MINRIFLMLFIGLLAYTVNLGDVAKKSESLALSLAIIYITVPLYLVFKILQEIPAVFKNIKNKYKK
ncbi:MAG: hypothetical protein CMG74_03845 [Candidatus Marinimicrobia bacterium]|nr:hypothetical protein [Candidatus Neomarinimicrobiota bacterium]